MKKVFVILFLLFCGVGFSGTYSGGDGEVSTPYQIAAAADWTELVATSADWTKSFVVTASIDFGAASIGQVGTSAAAFSGTFNGNGFTFSNFTLETPGADNDVALFGNMSGTVKNLVVSGATVTGGNNVVLGASCYTGTIAGEVHEGGRVENCTVSNCALTLTQAQNVPCYIGAVAGANHGTVQNCTVIGGTVSADRTAGANVLYIGGIVGYQTGGTTVVGKTENCTSTMAVSDLADLSNGYTDICVGGIVGKAASSAAGDNNIINCTHTGAISYTAVASNNGATSGLRIGGVVGQVVLVDVRGCSHSGNITVSVQDTQPARVGGIIAEANGNTSLVSRCFSSAAISNLYKAGVSSYVGGIVGYGTCGAGEIWTASDCYVIGSFYDATAASTTIAKGSWGGIVGYAIRGTMLNCYAALSTYADGGAAAYVGGACGYASSDPDQTYCYWDSSTSGLSTGVGGGTTDDDALAKTTAEMKQKQTFRGWNFVEIWAFEGTHNSGYPLLDNNSLRGRSRLCNGIRYRYGYLQ